VSARCSAQGIGEIVASRQTISSFRNRSISRNGIAEPATSRAHARGVLPRPPLDNRSHKPSFSIPPSLNPITGVPFPIQPPQPIHQFILTTHLRGSNGSSSNWETASHINWRSSANGIRFHFWNRSRARQSKPGHPRHQSNKFTSKSYPPA
jgi:hypothetical protein